VHTESPVNHPIEHPAPNAATATQTPTHDSNHRYIAGQQLYIAECNPAARATIRIDNTNLAHPTA
jgi:uridine kinase